MTSSTIIKIAIFEDDILPYLLKYSDKFIHISLGHPGTKKYGLIEKGIIKLQLRGVIARRTCSKCNRTFIQKPWYKNWLGHYQWMETQK